MAHYFASDFHLGLDIPILSKEREKIIIQWIDNIKDDLDVLYILGDLFDYWFEYKKVIPKGHVRILAKIAELTDSGIPVHLYTGNHDMWMFGYLEDEIGVTLHKKPNFIEIGNKKFMLGHGDGLGPGDTKYKILKKIFSNKLNQWFFERIHPNTGVKMMKYSSQKSRKSQPEIYPFLGPEKEWLIKYAERKLETMEIDYFIFGHRHLPIDYTLSNGKSRYINTGDWITHNTYAKFENGKVSLIKYNQ